jgi:hypothetical protein
LPTVPPGVGTGTVNPGRAAFESQVTEKIHKVTVFGGLEAVLEDVVRIQVPSA